MVAASTGGAAAPDQAASEACGTASRAVRSSSGRRSAKPAGARLPVRSADDHELSAAGDPALHGASLRLAQCGAVVGPHDGRQPVERLGAFGNVGERQRQRRRQAEVVGCVDLRAERPRPVADDGELVGRLLEHADLDDGLDRAVRLAVLDGDAPLERLRLDVEHDHLARAGRHLDESLNGAFLRRRGEVALGRLAVVDEGDRDGHPAADRVAAAGERTDLDVDRARGAYRERGQEQRAEEQHGAGQGHRPSA